MKKIFKEPKIEIVELNATDIILASGGLINGGTNTGTGDPVIMSLDTYTE